jgi:hypothetical protein
VRQNAEQLTKLRKYQDLGRAFVGQIIGEQGGTLTLRQKF